MKFHKASDLVLLGKREGRGSVSRKVICDAECSVSTFLNDLDIRDINAEHDSWDRSRNVARWCFASQSTSR